MHRLELTARQRETFIFVRDYLTTYRRAPTLDEVRQGIGARSINSAQKLVAAIERKGYIERESGRARSIRLVENKDAGGISDPLSQNLRILEPLSNSSGSIVRPSAETISVDFRFLQGISQPALCFMARAGDHAMAPDGIFRSDLVLVEPFRERRAVHGEMILCEIPGDFLVRRLYETEENIQFVPSDRTYATILSNSPNEGIGLLGRVLGVMRRL